MNSPSRRTFVKQSVLGTTSALLWRPDFSENPPSGPEPAALAAPEPSPYDLDLTPARWIWLPSQRTLPNTVLFFRKTLILTQKPTRATGWLLGDSRYKLYANGQRVQFGPAPSDPRWAEADPVDLTDFLQPGENVLGAQVLFYGHGDGTWPIGKPGFIAKLDLEFPDGTRQTVISDETWRVAVARAWRPGQYKRWYLRAFQESFDARLYPSGWNQAGFSETPDWLPAGVLRGVASQPPISTASRDYLYDAQGNASVARLRRRSVPLVREEIVPVKTLTEQFWLRWKQPAEDYFDFVTPTAGAFDVERAPVVREAGSGRYEVNMPADRAAVLTFELAEQHVGFPRFSLTAPAGTVVELLVHEAHQPGTDALINTHFNSWTRFICREGRNDFETFDYESFRWLQLHIREARGPVVVEAVGLRRRVYPFQNQVALRSSDAGLNQLFAATVNTIFNCCQETIVDGMARERQQYSGDLGHILHALLGAFGDTALAARFVNTYSQGLTLDGFFLDAWPAFDRLARLMERQMGLTEWGPILDHGVGFNFDCYHYHLYTGDATALREVFPRLAIFYRYLLKIRDSNGLLPVENLGVPAVWIDHSAYQRQRHKQCAFNLYAAAMLRQAFAPLCRVFGETALAAEAEQAGKALEKAVVARFWDAGRKLFVNNKPWLSEEKTPRFCDRSLATALLFGQLPGNQTAGAVRMLADAPPELGISYPANANWRYWALARFGRVQTVLDDLRRRWVPMASVRQNNTLGEWWDLQPDTGLQWSHCPVAPLYLAYMSLAGITPLKPGFAEVEIRPQLGDLTELSLTQYTVKGPLTVRLFQPPGGALTGEIGIPEGVRATLVSGGKRVALKAGNNAV
jgi:hypothetical protein